MWLVWKKSSVIYLFEKMHKKWRKHECTNCGGLGHPKAVCTTNQKKKDKEQDFNKGVFLLTTPEGIHRIYSEKFNFPSTGENQNDNTT